MKCKEGDRVKVRSDLKEGQIYGGCNITSDMARLSGKTVVITSCCDDRYHIASLWEHWTDEMFEGLVKEESKMFASELMELARKEPQKYEGKRYKVVSGSPLENGSQTFYECVMCKGSFKSPGKNLYLAVFDDTKLEEIPQPVSFMDAVNSRKKFKYFNWDNYYSPSAVARILASNTNDTILRLINDNQWLIEA